MWYCRKEYTVQSVLILIECLQQKFVLSCLSLFRRIPEAEKGGME